MPRDQVALWYRRYRQADYMLCRDEEDAAGIGAAMEDNGGAYVTGVQFADGRVIERDNWAAFTAAKDRLIEANAEPLPPRAVRTIRDPFRDDLVEIDTGEPLWLGKREMP